MHFWHGDRNRDIPSRHADSASLGCDGGAVALRAFSRRARRHYHRDFGGSDNVRRCRRDFARTRDLFWFKHIEDYVAVPFVLGRRLILNPVVLFVWLIFWGWLWSMPGALKKDADDRRVAPFEQRGVRIAGSSTPQIQESPGDDKAAGGRKKRRGCFDREANRKISRSPDKVNRGESQPDSQRRSSICARRRDRWIHKGAPSSRSSQRLAVSPEPPL